MSIRSKFGIIGFCVLFAMCLIAIMHAMPRLPSINAGDQFPKATIIGWDGQIDVIPFTGNKSVVLILSESCRSCIVTAENYKNIQKSLKTEKKFHLIPIFIDREKKSADKKINQLIFNEKNVWRATGDFMHLFPSRVVPQIYFLDECGRVIYTRVGERELTTDRGLVDKLF